MNTHRITVCCSDCGETLKPVTVTGISDIKIDVEPCVPCAISANATLNETIQDLQVVLDEIGPNKGHPL